MSGRFAGVKFVTRLVCVKCHSGYITFQRVRTQGGFSKWHYTCHNCKYTSPDRQAFDQATHDAAEVPLETPART